MSADRTATDEYREQAFTALWYQYVGLPSDTLARTEAFHDIDANFTEELDFLPRYAYVSEIPDEAEPPTVSFSDDLAELTSAALGDVHGPSMYYPICFFDLDKHSCQRITVMVDFGEPVS